jgi:FkbM family methyltransferase
MNANIEEKINGIHYLQPSKGEMDFILCPVAKETEKPDFTERYQKLINGLDDESIFTVNKLIDRCKQVAGGVSRIPMDENESKILTDIRKNFLKKITRINDKKFAYMQYFFPILHFEVPIFYHKLHMDSLRTLGNIRDKNIIDAGAFVGDSALIFSKYTNKEIFAFEPITIIYCLLLETIRMNNLTNVVPLRMGLGDKNETKSIYMQGSSSSFIEKEGCFTESNISVTTIDDFVEKDNLQIGLIKADIEGFEQYMLRGAERTIKTQKPALMVCIYHSVSDFFDIKPLIESWDLGYKFRIVKPECGSIFTETVLIAEVA